MRSRCKDLVRGSGLVVFATLATMIVFMGCANEDMAGDGLQGQGGGGPISLNLINNCDDMTLNVLVNTNGSWLSGGSTKCAGGDTCVVTPGTYPLDLGSSGLDFFVGDSVDNATKAEVTFLDVLTYDISTISTSGCPEECGSAACCKNGFNESLQISTDPSCRCVDCTSETCPDAYHWPHDDIKQIRCDPTTSISSLTIEFCPASSCPSTGFSDCTATQRTACADPSDQPCTGNKSICCPEESFGGSHACYCETAEQFCATAPDASSGCGSDESNYCFVAFTE
ncbi:MAG: hypothetical protein WBG86_07640 [Polyangiales bacterium]